jgi:hypothetical protein
VHNHQTLTNHQTLLLQGVLNFFLEQGKIALVASEDTDTKAWFDQALEQQVGEKMGCELIRLDALTDPLDALNVLLSGISVQQATQPESEMRANFLLWVTESEHFTQERFQLLKQIILQFSGLDLKLFVSVTSDRWSSQLFDIAGRKISYWFIPASVSAGLTSAAVVAHLDPKDQSHSQVQAPIQVAVAQASEIPVELEKSPLAQAGVRSNAQQRRFKPVGLVVGVLILLVSTMVFLKFKSAAEPNMVSSAPRAADAPRAVAEGAQQAPQSPTAPSRTVASGPAETPRSGSASVQQLDASSSKAASADSATETLVACPQPRSVGTLPTAKPVVFNKETNYIFIKTDQDRAICVAPNGGPYQLVNLRAIKGTRIYGNGPWRVYSPELLRFELYFQGARVTLGPNVIDHVQVIPY